MGFPIGIGHQKTAVTVSVPIAMPPMVCAPSGVWCRCKVEWFAKVSMCEGLCAGSTGMHERLLDYHGHYALRDRNIKATK